MRKARSAPTRNPHAHVTTLTSSTTTTPPLTATQTPIPVTTEPHHDDGLVDAAEVIDLIDPQPPAPKKRKTAATPKPVIINADTITIGPAWRHKQSDVEACYKLPRVQVYTDKLSIEYIHNDDMRVCIDILNSDIMHLSMAQHTGKSGRLTVVLTVPPAVSICMMTGPGQRVRYVPCTREYDAESDELIYSTPEQPEAVVLPTASVYTITVKQYNNAMTQLISWCDTADILLNSSHTDIDMNSKFDAVALSTTHVFEHADDDTIDRADIERAKQAAERTSTMKAHHVDKFMKLLNT